MSVSDICEPQPGQDVLGATLFSSAMQIPSRCVYLVSDGISFQPWFHAITQALCLFQLSMGRDKSQASGCPQNTSDQLAVYCAISAFAPWTCLTSVSTQLDSVFVYCMWAYVCVYVYVCVSVCVDTEGVFLRHSYLPLCAVCCIINTAWRERIPLEHKHAVYGAHLNCLQWGSAQ